MQNRKRLTPITLPGETPVTQFIIDRLFTQSFFFEPICDLLFELCRGQAIELATIDCFAITGKAQLATLD